MSFATNPSAFGIKPSTPSANPFGAPKPAGSLFGSTQPQQSAPLFGAFGQQQSQQQQQPTTTTSSIFGQPAQQQTTTTGGSLFGQTGQQQQTGTTGTTGSLFGQPAQQQQTSTGSSLFGQPAQQQPASTSLFGQPVQQQQPASTGLFGQPAQQQQQSGATGSIFGQPTQQQQPAPGSTLFGSTTQPAQQTSGFGGFGTLGSTQSTQPQTSGFGTSTLQPQATLPASSFGSTLGQTQNPLFGGQKPPQTLGSSTAQPGGQSLFNKSTKFNDLPDDVKRIFENIESHIQGRIQISKELHQLKLGDEASKGQEFIRSVHKELVNTSSVIHSDILFTRDIKAKADQAVQDTIIATRIVDGFKNPQQHGGYSKNHASFPLEFFTRITEQMKERLAWYKATIEQIERKLSSSANQTQYTPQAISATLQAQHATFITLASKTAALDSELQKIKAIYTQLWRAKTGSMRDPFNDLDRGSGGDLGLGSLNLK